MIEESIRPIALFLTLLPARASAVAARWSAGPLLWRRQIEAGRLQRKLQRVDDVIGFSDQGALEIGERDSDLARGQIGLVNGQSYDPFAHVVRDAVPDALRPGPMIIERIEAASGIAIEPSIERRFPDSDPGECVAQGQRPPQLCG